MINGGHNDEQRPPEFSVGVLKWQMRQATEQTRMNFNWYTLAAACLGGVKDERIPLPLRYCTPDLLAEIDWLIDSKCVIEEGSER